MERPTIRGSRRRSRCGGFSYIGVLILLAIISAALAGVMDVWHTTMQREKERELLFIGNQFRLALKSYYLGPPAGRYPTRVEDLLLDSRAPTVRRHLRRIYVDPMTGQSEWGLNTLPDGQIVGIHSLSNEQPLKVSGFSALDADLDGKSKYSDWVFSFKLPAAAPATRGTPRVQAGAGKL